MLRKNKGNYVFDEKGNVIAWQRSNDEDIKRELDYLRYEIEKLKQDNRQREEFSAGGNFSSSVFGSNREVKTDIQVNDADIQRAADKIKSALKKAFD